MMRLMPLEEPMTGMYRAVVTLVHPIMVPWSRLSVHGLEHIPTSGPTLLVANHDSHWDPLAIAFAARSRRQVRALAKESLWRQRGLSFVMTRLGHIPVSPGRGVESLDQAITALREGACIGIFPEGTTSLGRELPARTGVGRLMLAAPETTLVGVRISGATDIVRAPVRPRVVVEMFCPANPRPGPDETPQAFSQRILTEIRAVIPPTIQGRNRTRRRYAAQLER